MWFQSVHWTPTHDGFLVEYKLVDNYNKEESQAFSNFKDAINKLVQIEEYRSVYQSFKIAQDIKGLNYVSYTIPKCQIIQQERELQPAALNSLFKQLKILHSHNLFIGEFCFDQIIYKDKNYYFLILPGLIQADDATDRSINLASSLYKLVRGQLLQKLTNEKLEFLSFLKNLTIFQSKSDFNNIKNAFFNQKEGEIQLVVSEQIEFSYQKAHIVTVNFSLKYNSDYVKGKKIDQLFNFEYSPAILDCLDKAQNYLKYESEKILGIQAVNKITKEKINTEAQLDDAIEKFFSAAKGKEDLNQLRAKRDYIEKLQKERLLQENKEEIYKNLKEKQQQLLNAIDECIQSIELLLQPKN